MTETRIHQISEHRLAQLLEAERFVRDVAAFGVRADVAPTIGGGSMIGTPDDVTGWYSYIRGIDSGMRRRAAKVLSAEADSRNAADGFDEQGPDDALTVAGYKIVRADDYDSATDPARVKTWNPEQEDLFRRTWSSLRTAPLMSRGRGAGKSTALREMSRRLGELATVDHDEFRRRLDLPDPEPESAEQWHERIETHADQRTEPIAEYCTCRGGPHGGYTCPNCRGPR